MACSRCGSFFDGDHVGRGFSYDGRYPEERGHFEEATGAMKRRSLQRWLDAVGLDVAGTVVCEVGFGGAHCLRHVADRADRVFGIEAVEENLQHARDLHLDDVHAFDARPDPLPVPVDVWLLLDSFEHLPEPHAFLEWLGRSSAPEARVVLVAPEAGSMSDRLLGRLWPHKLPDHAFHWSRRGLLEVWRTHGFEPVREFHPGKYVSGAMVAAHLRLKLSGTPVPEAAMRLLERVRLYFNVGEMGVLLRKVAPAGGERPA